MMMIIIIVLLIKFTNLLKIQIEQKASILLTNVKTLLLKYLWSKGSYSIFKLKTGFL